MDEYISIFEAIAAAGQRIRLMNLFKGVPIAYEAEIVEVSLDSVTVRTDRSQIVCLYRERETYIQNAQLPGIVVGKLQAMRIHQLEAVLSGFTAASHSLGDRMQVRVQLAEPLRSDVRPAGAAEPFPAELGDISQDGLAIFIPRNRFYPPSYAHGARITIVLQLPGAYETLPVTAGLTPTNIQNPMERFNREALRLAPLPPAETSAAIPSAPRQRKGFPEMEIHGSVANAREEAGGRRYRVGIRIQPADPSRRLIYQFITQRQAEIIRELRELTQLISR